MATPVLEKVEQSVKALFSVSGSIFSLESYPGFPYKAWVKMQERYSEWQDWFDGIPLDAVDDAGQELYPIKINPIPNSCEKHATFLLGNTLESIRDGGVPVSFSFSNDTEPTRAEELNEVLKAVFLASGGGSLFAENAQLTQYLGGCVFGVAWRPQDDQKVQIISPEPPEFYGRPDGLQKFRLRECWFVRKISASDAAAFGYTVIDPLDETIPYYYIEYWSKKEYRISVNEKVLVVDDVKQEGVNPYGEVPFVYIPHIRIRGFWGLSMITKTIIGAIKEMNLRFGDVGDGVSDDSHTPLFMRGVRQALKTQKVPSTGRIVTDIGSSPGLSPNDTEPDVFSVQTASASAPALKFGETLENMYRREARHPAVADGEDEGSQRSSLTLTTRMLPLVSHVRLERINWTLGLLWLIKLIFLVSSKRGVNNITEADLKAKAIIKWAPMLPRDREELVNEVAVRKKNAMLSTKHGLEMFQDVDDIETELQLIDEDQDKAAERAMKLKQATTAGESEPNPQEQNNFKKEKE